MLCISKIPKELYVLHAGDQRFASDRTGSKHVGQALL